MLENSYETCLLETMDEVRMTKKERLSQMHYKLLLALQVHCCFVQKAARRRESQ